MNVISIKYVFLRDEDIVFSDSDSKISFLIEYSEYNGKRNDGYAIGNGLCSNIEGVIICFEI